MSACCRENEKPSVSKVTQWMSSPQRMHMLFANSYKKNQRFCADISSFCAVFTYKTCEIIRDTTPFFRLQLQNEQNYGKWTTYIYIHYIVQLQHKQFVIIYLIVTCEALQEGLSALLPANATDNNTVRLWAAYWFLQDTNHLTKQVLGFSVVVNFYC